MPNDFHQVDIIPPDRWDLPWKVVCSQGDIRQGKLKYRETPHHEVAQEIAFGHIHELAKMMTDKRTIADWEKTL